MALSRVVQEQRKTQKRVNALRYNVIPRYRETIRYIENALEEEERDEFFDPEDEYYEEENDRYFEDEEEW